MAHISIDIDDDIKARAEAACQAMGITLAEVLADRVTELAVDPFYSIANITELKSASLKWMPGLMCPNMRCQMLMIMNDGRI